MPFKSPDARNRNQRERRAEKRDRLGAENPPGGDGPDAPGAPTAEPEPVAPIAIRTAADVLAAIEEAVNMVRADRRAGPQVKARSIGYLAAVAMKALEARDVAARLEAIEKVLKARGKERHK